MKITQLSLDKTAFIENVLFKIQPFVHTAETQFP